MCSSAYTDCLPTGLYGPAWDKCKHETRRGAVVGGITDFWQPNFSPIGSNSMTNKFVNK